MGSELSDQQKNAAERSTTEGKAKLPESVHAEVFGARVTQVKSESDAASKPPEVSDSQKVHPTHELNGYVAAGIAVAGTALLIAGIKYKPLRGLAEDVFRLGGEGTAERVAKLLPKYPELGLDKLVTKITDNLNQGCITRENFNHLVSSVPKADQGLASAIARRSISNASDFAMMHSMRDMGAQLESQGLNLNHVAELTTAHAASPGQTTAYLFRKANTMKLGIHNLGSTFAPTSGAVESKAPIMLFDHISEFSPAQREHLQKVAQSGRPIFLMDTNNFQAGINFTDAAKGTAETKLHGLVEQAKSLRKETPLASDGDLAHRVLNGKTDADAAELGATVIRPTSLADDVLFRQMVNRDKVEQFLSRYSDPTQKRLAAETLADIEYDSFSGIAKKTQKLNDVIAADAKAAGMDPQNDIQYLVGIDAWPNMGASSGGMISSIYRDMNGLPPRQFVDFDKAYFQGTNARRTYVLDDMSHSGEQIREVATDLRREYGFGGLSFSTLSALKSSTVMKYSVETGTPKGLRFLTAEAIDPLAESSKAAIKALKADHGFFQSPSHELQQARVRRDVWSAMTRDVKDKRMMVANQLNPYVVSDRTNPVTADFAREVLKMGQPGYIGP